MSVSQREVVTKEDITFTALTKVLKVDPKELKKATLIQTLREAADGKLVEIICPDFYIDILELIEELQSENEKLENLNSQLLSRGDDLAKENKELLRRINKARGIVECPCVYQTYPNPHKKYRGEAVTCIINGNLSVFHKRMNEIEDALEE
jgi:hypothetical protein